MRIISGEYGGRRLKTIPGKNTRPTSDKVKESLFHMIGPYFDGRNVLDLYSGSGALGIEAVSRGMDHAFLIDYNYQAIKVINENVKITKKPEKFTVWKEKDMLALERLKQLDISFDLVFLDPPYDKQKLNEILKKLVDYNLLNEQSIIVCETDKDVALPVKEQSLIFVKEKVYASTRLSIYKKESSQ
ncbi:16S rRNA (guanine(966)-N(2))-methyltransferase RsmD [Alkalibacterium kapii]|uniref:Methyltransferase n=1 Tax=Alkalibacterium kapii TaxID=426704 RepID=A0A511AV06_9LACT|nr:16S rRNA (guanine(966)-N(2))-methyltransferase RsmD [Alkalibacterium kapii]GEK91512.1 methyltransferase [Alkalibacterium kapii]